MQLIDTHAHISFDSYDEDRTEMMQRAFKEGVCKLLHPCCTLKEVERLEELTKEFNGDQIVDVYMAIGVHPCEISSWNDESPALMDTLIAKYKSSEYKLRAVGETGLDYFHCKEAGEQARQRDIFKTQIGFAKKYDLPVIVHTRDAWEDTLTILKEEYLDRSDRNNGVIHCFTGDYEFASECIKLGFFISWSGVVTYKKNDHFREIAAKLPIDHVLIETDSPFLAPQVFRGKRNEPGYVSSVADVVADCYQIAKEELAQKTTANAQTLFNF